MHYCSPETLPERWIYLFSITKITLIKPLRSGMFIIYLTTLIAGCSRPIPHPKQYIQPTRHARTYNIGDLISYQCLPFCTFTSGSPQSRCQSDGKWQKPTLKCKFGLKIDQGSPGAAALLGTLIHDYASYVGTVCIS